MSVQDVPEFSLSQEVDDALMLLAKVRGKSGFGGMREGPVAYIVQKSGGFYLKPIFFL
jgi:hypothetical protein